MIINILIAIVYGTVEGICEWLPISSTGHLILLEEILPIELGEKYGEEFSEVFRATFDVVVQLAAVAAIPIIYRKDLFSLSNDAHKLRAKILVATLPAAIIGLLADALCEKIFGADLSSVLFRAEVVAIALIVYGILFILIERATAKRKNEYSDISFRKALAIGFFQSLALVPGTSRSGATILGARILKTEKNSAAEFSFFAAIPVICAASALKILDLARYMSTHRTPMPPDCTVFIAVASLTAFAVSVCSVKFLIEFIRRHSFAPFGVYRIALGLLVLAHKIL